MHEFICFNREIKRAGETFISAVSSAALYGKGIFTTVAISGGKPFLWEKHWRRLVDNAARLQIDLSNFFKSSLEKSFFELLEKNNCINGRARITFYDERTSQIWNAESLKQTSFLIITADLREVKENLRVGISPYLINSTSPLAGIKSCNYLENTLSLEEANERGFDEAIRTNERGEIASACMANVFWMKDGEIFTPSLKTGCLAGTTREFLTEKFEVAEVEQTLEVLETADAIFLTSSGIGVVQAAEFENRKFEHIFEEIIQIS